MIQYKRPPKPPGFDARVKSAREALDAACARGDKLGADHFPDLWSHYKAEFRTAQHEKCGYCETRLQEVGVIDHFRPKGAVWGLSDDPEDWGDEISGLTNMRGRDPVILCHRGYYWLAYTWENYVLSCERCNTAWKLAYFPVVEDPRPLPPSPDQPDTPLLLNPYDDEAPWRHFDFADMGAVSASSPDDGRGYETIRTYSLDRPSLQRDRRRLMPVLLDNLRQYRTASLEARKLAWRTLCHMGADNGHHSGMIRRMVERALGLFWEQFVAREPEQRVPGDPA